MEELTKVVRSLIFARERLSLDTMVNAEFIAPGGKLYASVSLDRGFYDNCLFSVTLEDEPTEQSFQILSYPIVEFKSVLSLINPMITKLRFLETHGEFLTKTIIRDAIRELEHCENILTVRTTLTNFEACVEWRSAFNKPIPDSLFVSIFPFRDSIYVTVYQVRPTDGPLRELKTKASPFDFSPKSVIEVSGQRYCIIQSTVAKQSLEFLGHTLRSIRNAIEQLEVLEAVKPVLMAADDREDELEARADVVQLQQPPNMEVHRLMSWLFKFSITRPTTSVMAKKLRDATDGAAEMTDERLISDFGCKPLDEEILQRWYDVTKVRPHMFMRRGLFFAHRELEQILDAKEKGKPIFIYTGRGPSSDALHLGHLVPFILTKYIQEALDCYCIVQVTDDEKFIRDKDLTWEQIQRYTDANIRDILAQGLNPDKTFIMRESKWFDINVPFLTEMSKVMSLHVIKNLFGFNEEHSVGYVVFPAKQIAPAFAQYFAKLFKNPKDVVCLIPCGREQDPYFRFARETAKRLKLRRVSTIYGRFIPALQGDKKMTASSEASAIYLTDSADQVRSKIMEHAFTSYEEGGADLKTDVVFQYLSALDDDDEWIAKATRCYGKEGVPAEGETKMTVNELKERLINVLVELLGRHQERRTTVTDEVMDKFESLKIWE